MAQPEFGVNALNSCPILFEISLGVKDKIIGSSSSLTFRWFNRYAIRYSFHFPVVDFPVIETQKDNHFNI